MTKHLRMSAEVAAWIKALHRDQPKLFQHEIAFMIGRNQGRVSEVLNGKRYPEVTPSYPAVLYKR